MQLVSCHMQCYFDITYDGYCSFACAFQAKLVYITKRFTLKECEPDSASSVSTLLQHYAK